MQKVYIKICVSEKYYVTFCLLTIVLMHVLRYVCKSVSMPQCLCISVCLFTWVCMFQIKEDIVFPSPDLLLWNDPPKDAYSYAHSLEPLYNFVSKSTQNVNNSLREHSLFYLNAFNLSKNFSQQANSLATKSVQKLSQVQMAGIKCFNCSNSNFDRLSKAYFMQFYIRCCDNKGE